MDEMTNASQNTNSSDPCDLQPENPWCGEFGTRQIFEVIYLITVAVVGTCGNILVIASIAYKKRIHKNGNIFIVNLAIADLTVTGIIIPTVTANVFETGQALPDIPCMIIGYIVTITCICSVCNLTFIALNRYWAVAHAESYDKTFSKMKTFIMVAFTWFWSNLIATPTLYGWAGLGYDSKMLQCAWDDTASIAYNILLMVCAILIPLCVVSFCYYKLFLNVKSRGKWMRSVSNKSSSSKKRDLRSKKQKLLAREVNLLKTLATTVILFVLCWVPYGFTILINPKTTPEDVKKVVGWLGLSNSAVNFLIYGLMNKVFRKGYKDFLTYLFCCASTNKSVASALAFTGLTAGVRVQAKKHSHFNTNSISSAPSTPITTRNMKIHSKSESTRGSVAINQSPLKPSKKIETTKEKNKDSLKS